MLKALLSTAALGVLLAAHADAQGVNPPARAATSAAQPADAGEGAFLPRQLPNEWRGTKLIGVGVYGPGNTSIGNINELIVGPRGDVRAAVIGVGGFLGIGEKNVAVPFKALQIVRKQNASSVEKVTIAATKEQLQQAPTFAYLEANGANNTTASGSASGAAQNARHAGPDGGGAPAQH